MKNLLLYTCIFFLAIQGVSSQEDFNKESFKGFGKIKDTVRLHQAVGHLEEITNTNDEVEVIAFADYLIKVSERLKDTSALGDIYLNKGRVYLNSKKSQAAIKQLNEAVKRYKITKNDLGLADAYNEYFMVEYRSGNVEKSAYYLQESKTYFEKVKDSLSLATVYNRLGIVHMSLKDYELSEKAYLKSILIKNNIGDTEVIGRPMNNLAILYIENKEFDKAEGIVKKSLLINKRDNLTKLIAHSYTIYGDIAIGRKEYQKAKKYYDSTLSLYGEEKDDLMIVDAKQQLGYIAIQLRNYKEAEKMLKIARDEFSEIGAKSLLLKNYQFSSKLDSARGDLSRALNWQVKYQNLSDKISADLSTQKIESAENRYQAELEQLRTIDDQEIREQRNNEELFRYRILTLIILGILFVSMLFALWIIRTRKERKGLITKLNESNQVKHKLFSIISHDLKNEIHGLESSLNLMQDNELSPEEFEEIVPLLADRTNHTSILLNNLLNWSKSQMKELRANPVVFDITEVINNKFIFFKPKAHQKDVKLINKLERTMVYADKDMIGIVAQNLIANAIKFCKAGDSITLQSVAKGDSYEIGFADTGVGIDRANLNKLFAEETFTTHGTQNESGTGLGLRICRELVELNKGNIRVESTLGEGSTFFISLPKARG